MYISGFLTMAVSLNLDQAHELEQAFNHFNAALFNKELKPCRLTLCHLPKTDAQFIRSSWEHPESGETYHELQLNQELVRSGKRAFCEALVHLMCHVWQHDHGQSKPSSHDHNKEFVSLMKLIGFESEATHGRSLEFEPLPKGKFMQSLSTLPELTLLKPTNSSAMLDTDDTRSKGRSGKRDKWGCPNGHGTAYASKSLEVICAQCQQAWVKLS
jgi:hypothetical protein